MLLTRTVPARRPKRSVTSESKISKYSLLFSRRQSRVAIKVKLVFRNKAYIVVGQHILITGFQLRLQPDVDRGSSKATCFQVDAATPKGQPFPKVSQEKKTYPNSSFLLCHSSQFYFCQRKYVKRHQSSSISIYCVVNVKIKTCTSRSPPNILSILGFTELPLGMSLPLPKPLSHRNFQPNM